MSLKTRKVNRRRLRPGELMGGTSSLYVPRGYQNVGYGVLQIDWAITVLVDGMARQISADWAGIGWQYGQFLPSDGLFWYDGSSFIPVVRVELSPFSLMEIEPESLLGEGDWQLVVPSRLAGFTAPNGTQCAGGVFTLSVS